MEPVRFYDSIAKNTQELVWLGLSGGPGEIVWLSEKKIDKSAVVYHVEGVETTAYWKNNGEYQWN